VSVPCCNSCVAFSVHKMLYNCRSANGLVSPNVRNKTLFSPCKEPWMNQHIHWWYQQLEWRMVITLLVWGFCCHLGCIVAPLRLFVCLFCLSCWDPPNHSATSRQASSKRSPEYYLTQKVDPRRKNTLWQWPLDQDLLLSTIQVSYAVIFTPKKHWSR
jgi:hypothetical protein